MTTEYARLRTRGPGTYVRERMPTSGGSPIVAGMEPSRGAPLARGRALAVDVLLVVGVAAIQVLGCWGSERIGLGPSPDWRPFDPLAFALLVAGAGGPPVPAPVAGPGAGRGPGLRARLRR